MTIQAMSTCLLMLTAASWTQPLQVGPQAGTQQVNRPGSTVPGGDLNHCGNGECDQNESYANCPRDCYCIPEPVESYCGYADDIQPIKDSYRDRCESYVATHLTHPFPPISDQSGYYNYAVAAFLTGQDMDQANAYLESITLAPDEDYLDLNIMLRVYLLFGSEGTMIPDRLSQNAEDVILAQLWNYVRGRSKLNQTNNTWKVWGSENHDMEQKSTYLLAAQIFLDHPIYHNMPYASGGTAADHYSAWANYFDDYFVERAEHGLFVEVKSPIYQKYLMQGMFNIMNFCNEGSLRIRARAMIDLLFADWAHLQTNLLAGGGRSRTYANSYSLTGVVDELNTYGQLLIGSGTSSARTGLFLVTSGYYLPNILTHVALTAPYRTAYMTRARRPGGGSINFVDNVNGAGNYNVDPQRSVLTTTYNAGGAHILGSIQRNPNKNYTKISTQNQWHGVIFATAPEARAYVQARMPVVKNELCTYFPKSAYETHISVQHENVMISQMERNSEPDALASRIYLAPALDLVEYASDGWIFVSEGGSTGSYLGIYVADGDYTLCDGDVPELPNYCVGFVELDEIYSPIIFETALQSSYTNFEEFKADMRRNPLSFWSGVDGQLDYTVSFVSNLGPDEFFIEAEPLEAQSIGDFEMQADDDAYNNTFVWIPPCDNGKPSCQQSGEISYVISVPEEQQYCLYARVLAPSGMDDSVRIQIDEQPITEWDFDVTQTWQWQEMNSCISGPCGCMTLSAGEHTIRLMNRENGTQIDALVLAKQSGRTPATLTYFNKNQKKIPRINGIELDFAPTYALEGPIINSAWESGIYEIDYAGQLLRIDMTDLDNLISEQTCVEN